MKFSGFVLSALLAGFVPAAQAGGMIKCVDDKGVTHYGDKLPPQCVGHATAELNKRGIVVKTTERALTPEEAKTREAEAEQHRIEVQKDAEQKRRDYALLASYGSEREIDAARDREVQRVEAGIANARGVQQKQTTESEKQRINAMIDNSRKEIEAINARYDGYKARYLELKKARAAGDRLSKS